MDVRALFFPQLTPDGQRGSFNRMECTAGVILQAISDWPNEIILTASVQQLWNRGKHFRVRNLVIIE